MEVVAIRGKDFETSTEPVLLDGEFKFFAKRKNQAVQKLVYEWGVLRKVVEYGDGNKTHSISDFEVTHPDFKHSFLFSNYNSLTGELDFDEFMILEEGSWSSCRK